jgi:hypothetical protein
MREGAETVSDRTSTVWPRTSTVRSRTNKIWGGANDVWRWGNDLSDRGIVPAAKRGPPLVDQPPMALPVL